MFVILGASGNVGSNVVQALSGKGSKVIAVVHSAEKAKAINGSNVETAVVDVTDVDALRAVFRRGKRAFLLNPPADTSADTNAAELHTTKTITDALAGSGLEKIVVQSTYGAQEGDAIGDLSVLFEFERLAQASGIAVAINRGAYYFTNLDMLVEPARQGVLPTAFPATMKIPMVAAADLGEAAAARLDSSIEDVGIAYVEGPERYSFADVAAVLSRRLGREVSVQTTPRERWEESFRAVGFSAAAARSYARMTAVAIDDPDTPDAPRRGRVTLDEHIANVLGQ